MANVPALGAAQAAGLADAERREVVVMEIALGGLQPERVESHLLARGPERDDAERLRLPAGEQRRAMRPRSDADLDRDGSDLVGGAAVGPFLLNRNPFPDQRLLELVERPLGVAR